MSERLKELDTLKEDFISHVSHKLRTPLTSMREASHMLISGTYDNDPARRGELLTIVRDECNRLILSVNRILDLSRMESGMMAYQFVRTDLNQLIRSAVFKLDPIAQAKKIQLNFEPDPTCPPVMADGEQLHQLIENLIGNALKFTESPGSVTVKVMSPPAAGNDIQVSIADTGVGIDASHIENIFNKFKRIEKKKNTTRGTGLGLAQETFIDLAVIDYKLDGENGVDLMDKLRTIQQNLPVIILTAHGTIDKAVDAMKRGACTYVTKPFDGDELIGQIENCLAKAGPLRDPLIDGGQDELPAVFKDVITRSSAMKSVMVFYPSDPFFPLSLS
jgi:light-regulated signal transduction histidine kinase (bacteriophytochrome)